MDCHQCAGPFVRGVRPPAPSNAPSTRFGRNTNEERPHSHHAGTPTEAYSTGSARVYSLKLPPPEYPAHFFVERVTDAGTIRFQSRLLFLANALDNDHVGLEEVDDGIWPVFFGAVLLARVDERDYIIRK